jgi:hypothetical protein
MQTPQTQTKSKHLTLIRETPNPERWHRDVHVGGRHGIQGLLRALRPGPSPSHYHFTGRPNSRKGRPWKFLFNYYGMITMVPLSSEYDTSDSQGQFWPWISVQKPPPSTRNPNPKPKTPHPQPSD